MGRLPEVLAAGDAHGADVILVRRCTQEEESRRGDGREIFVRLRNDGSIYINEDPIGKKDLAPEVARIFAPRAEKVLTLVGEESVSYQRVAATAAELQGRIADLHIFLATTANLSEPDFCLVPVRPITWR